MKWCNEVVQHGADEVSPVRMRAYMTQRRRAWYF
jgi:hypothetical protein